MIFLGWSNCIGRSIGYRMKQTWSQVWVLEFTMFWPLTLEITLTFNFLTCQISLIVISQNCCEDAVSLLVFKPMHDSDMMVLNKITIPFIKYLLYARVWTKTFTHINCKGHINPAKWVLCRRDRGERRQSNWLKVLMSGKQCWDGYCVLLFSHGAQF